MLFGLFGLLFPECVPTVTQDTGDTGGEQTAWIVGIQFACDATGWTYEITAWGEPGDGWLAIYEEGTEYWEFHDMPAPVWNDAAQNWTYTLDLARVGDPDDVEQGESTVYGCTGATSGLNWHIIVDDIDGNQEDCAVFGSSPETLGFTECSLWAEESS